MKHNKKRSGLVYGIAHGTNLFILIGLLLHTDKGDSLVLGKYLLPHFCLILLFLIGTPFINPFFKRFQEPSKKRLPDGSILLISSKKKLLFFSLVLLVSLGALESSYQVKLLYQRQGPPKEYLLGFHPFLQIVPRSTSFKDINRFGFRGRELNKEKGLKTFRVFCLGGSTTLDPYLKFDETYCRKLEIILQASYPERSIEVQNAGMMSYTSQHSLINYSIRVQDYHPDLIIVIHAINDLIRSFTPPVHSIQAFGYQADYSHFLGPQADMFKDLEEIRRPGLAEASIVLNSMVAFFSSHLFTNLWKEEELELQDSEVLEFHSLESYRRNLETICDIAERRSTIVVLASEAYLYRLDLSEDEKKKIGFPRSFANDGTRKVSIPSMIRGMDLFNGTARDIAKERNLAFVDLESKIPKSLEFFIDDVHLTSAGTKIVAEDLARKIDEMNILKQRKQ